MYFLFSFDWGQEILFSEWKSPPSWAERRDNGRIDTQPVIGGGHTSNLFNIIREMTLRSEKLWNSPWTANRNNGAVLIVTLQSGTQWAIRGGLIRGVERWMTLWKGHCTLPGDFNISNPLNPPWIWNKVRVRQEKYNSGVITDFLDGDIFPSALVK